MGKGTIISGGPGGQYQLKIVYDNTLKDKAIIRLEESIVLLNAKIIAETDEIKRGVLRLERESCQSQIKFLNENCPEDYEISAWCADLTEDLSGDVGTIEVPGEIGNVNIRPGFEDTAAFSKERDGQLAPTAAMSPSASFYNLAMLPGWQKWKPTFRYATVTHMNGDKASILLEHTISSQQDLFINQDSSISDVDIEYMNCNGAAFSVDDEVLVLFSGQDFESPKIIGFKEEPKPCGEFLYLAVEDQALLWDMSIDDYAVGIPDGLGGTLTFPCTVSELSYWRANSSIVQPEGTFWAFPENILAHNFPSIAADSTAGFYSESDSTCPNVPNSTATISWDEERTPIKLYQEGLRQYDWAAGWADWLNFSGGKIMGKCFRSNHTGFETFTSRLAGTYFNHGQLEIRKENEYDDYWSEGESVASFNASATLITPMGSATTNSISGSNTGEWVLAGQGFKFTGTKDVRIAETYLVIELAYSINSIIQIHISQSRGYHEVFSGSETAEPYQRDVFVGLETEEDGLLQTGYDPAGALLHQVLTDFIKDNISVFEPDIRAEFRR